MEKFWRKAVRSILALGVTGVLMFASGCGDDDDDDDRDRRPDAFSFTPQTDVPLSTVVTSNPITVAGITSPAPISISNGTYSIGGGTFTSASGTVTNGQTVTVQHTSSAINSTVTTTTLDIGSVTAPFTSITVAAAGVDTTPDAFTFAPQTDVPLSTVSTSAPIIVAGINGPAPITITNGTYSIGGGTFTSTAGTVTNGQTVTVQNTSSATNNTPTTTTLTIGGVSAIFTTTTLQGAFDTTPDAFTFTPQTGVPLGTVSTSALITVAGINGPAPISVTNGTYSIDSGTFTSTAGTVTNGQTVRVQHTSSGTNNTGITTTLNIGGVTADFTTTTTANGAGLDTTPNPFSFTAQTGVPLSTASNSNVITVSGIDGATPISVTNGTYSINGGTFISAPGTVANGQNITVQHISSATNDTGTTTTLNIGGVTADFTTTTLAAGTTIDAAAVYQTNCASCHSLGTVDTTATIGPELSGTTGVASRFPTPDVPGHFNITLSADEIAALTAYFLDN